MSRGLVAFVDDGDLALVSRFSWSSRPDRHTVYARRSIRLPDGRKIDQTMHQLLTGWARTDHLNGNGLDNQRANLREATATQNMRNARKVKGHSRYKGIYLEWSTGLWRARIGVDYRQIHLGRYASELAAAVAYDCAARELFGDFAALNFPASGERSAIA